MKYRLLVGIGFSMGLSGAARTVSNPEKKVACIKSKAINFALKISAVSPWYTSTHGIFFPDDQSVLPQLVTLNTLEGRPVPATVTLSPKGSFWHAALEDKKNQCIWVDRLDTKSTTIASHSALQSIKLPLYCKHPCDIFWSSDDSTLCVFDRYNGSLTLYFMDNRSRSDLVNDNHPCFKGLHFGPDVQSLAYDPVTHSIAVLCNIRDGSVGVRYNSGCSSYHKIADVYTMSLPLGKKDYTLSQQDKVRRMKKYTVSYEYSPCLQYSDDGSNLLYTYTALLSIAGIRGLYAQRQGILFANKNDVLEHIRSLSAEQICFARDMRYIFLYSAFLGDRTQGKVIALDCKTNILRSRILSGVASGVLHSEGIIGFTQEGALNTITLLEAEEKDSDKALRDGSDILKGKGTD